MRLLGWSMAYAIPLLLRGLAGPGEESPVPFQGLGVGLGAGEPAAVMLFSC